MRSMGSSMRKLWTQHKDSILEEVRNIDVEKVENLKYLFEFDR